MRAVLVKEFGPVSDLVVDEVPDPSPGPGQIVVDVGAASINFPDVLVVEGAYQVLPPRPFSPGKEAAGRVSAVGEGVSGITVGDRVLAIVEHGAYAAKVCVSADWVVPIPAQMSDAQAASFGLVASTAHLALFRRANLQAGETVLITGAGGGVASFGVQLAKAAGCTVLALASEGAKADLARSQGADMVLTCPVNRIRDEVMAVTQGRGADVVLDVLGGDYLTQAIRATAWEGRVVVVGFAAGSQNPIKPGHLLVKNISVLGLQSSDYRDRTPNLVTSTMAEMFTLFTLGKVKAPIDAIFDLAQAPAALQRIKDGNVVGKLVLTTGTQV